MPGQGVDADSLRRTGQRWHGPRDENVAASFGDAAKRLAERPQLVRALVRTTAGRAARSSVRAQRVDAIADALEPLTAAVDRDTGRWATAVITHLCGAASWVLIADETGLEDADAQAAVAWAIDTLVQVLQTSAAARGTSRRGSRSRPPT